MSHWANSLSDCRESKQCSGEEKFRTSQKLNLQSNQFIRKQFPYFRTRNLPIPQPCSPQLFLTLLEGGKKRDSCQPWAKLNPQPCSQQFLYANRMCVRERAFQWAIRWNNRWETYSAFLTLQQKPAPEIKQTSFLKQEFSNKSAELQPGFVPEKVQPCLLLGCLKAQKEQNQPLLPLWIQLFLYLEIPVAASLGAKPFCSVFVKGLCPSAAVPLGSSWCGTRQGGAGLYAVPSPDFQLLLDMHGVGCDTQAQQPACRKVQRVKEPAERGRNASPDGTAWNTLPTAHAQC